MNKTYRVIEEFPEYGVAEDGSVYSFKKNKPLKPLPGTKQYLRVNLYNKSNGRKSVSIASLVLTAFVGPRPPMMQAAHLNGDNQDNRLENLAWVDRKTNESHKAIHGTKAIGERHGMSKLSSEDVAFIRRMYRKRGDAAPNARALATIFDVRIETITSIATGRARLALAAAEKGERNDND